MKPFSRFTLRDFNNDPATAALRAEVYTAASKARDIRAHVNSYIQPIFDRYEFYALPEFTEPGTDRLRITDYQDLWLAESTDEVVAFYAECDAAHKANGYDVKPDTSPALIAEARVVEAQNRFIKHVSVYFDMGDIPFVDTRKKVIDVLLDPSRMNF
jgi:hypothetical protein